MEVWQFVLLVIGIVVGYTFVAGLTTGILLRIFKVKFSKEKDIQSLVGMGLAWPVFLPLLLLSAIWIIAIGLLDESVWEDKKEADSDKGTS